MATDNNTTSSTSGLQLVPEILLKKRHNLEELQAKRAAAAITNPQISRKRSIANHQSGKNANQVKIVKPETILIQSRHRKNSKTRYERVKQKGMMKRASGKSLVKVKGWDVVREVEVELKEEEKMKAEGSIRDVDKEESDMQKSVGKVLDGDEDSAKDDEEDDENEKDKKDSKMEDGKAEKNAKKNSNKKHVKTETNDERTLLHKIPYKSNSIGATTVFAILLRPTRHTTPRPVLKTLSSLRLRRLHEGVFLRYDDRTRKMLHLVEPYVLYGIPSAEIISDLVRRRGFCRGEDGKRVRLGDNCGVERELGVLGLICVEDLVYVLGNGGLDGMEGGDVGDKTFGKVTKFLWPFRLTARKSKFQRKMLDMKDGKLYGDQGEAINGYIREML